MIALFFLIALPVYICVSIFDFIVNIPNLIIWNISNFALLSLIFIVIFVGSELILKRLGYKTVKSLFFAGAFLVVAFLGAFLHWKTEKPVQVNKKQYGHFRFTRHLSLNNQEDTRFLLLPNNQVFIYNSYQHNGQKPIYQLFDPKTEVFTLLDAAEDISFFIKPLKRKEGYWIGLTRNSHALVVYQPGSKKLVTLNIRVPLNELKYQFLLNDNQILFYGWTKKQKTIKNPLGENLKFLIPTSDSLYSNLIKINKPLTAVMYSINSEKFETTDSFFNAEYFLNSQIQQFELCSKNYLLLKNSVYPDLNNISDFLKVIYPKTKEKYPLVDKNYFQDPREIEKYLTLFGKGQKQFEIHQKFFKILYERIKSNKDLLNYIKQIELQAVKNEFYIVDVEKRNSYLVKTYPISYYVELQYQPLKVSCNSSDCKVYKTESTFEDSKTTCTSVENLNPTGKEKLLDYLLKAKESYSVTDSIDLKNGRYQFTTGYSEICHAIDCGFMGQVFSLGRKMKSHAHTNIYDRMTGENIPAPDSLIKAKPNALVELHDGRVLISTGNKTQLFIPGLRLENDK